MAKVLLVEDDRIIARLVQSHLEHEQLIVDWAQDGTTAVAWLRMVPYDLLILDWSLPDMTGVEICRQYRAGGGLSSILMLTSMGSVDNKATGLDAGADDYLVKPFHPTEFLARVRALLRRPKAMSTRVLKVRDLELNVDTKQLCRRGKEIELTPKEMGILELLMSHPNKSFTAEAIMARLWSSDSTFAVDTVRTHVKTLRKKLGDGESTAGSQLIASNRGLGYRIIADHKQGADMSHA